MYYDISLRERPVEIGLFVHGGCFMYRIDQPYMPLVSMGLIGVQLLNWFI